MGRSDQYRFLFTRIHGCQHFTKSPHIEAGSVFLDNTGLNLSAITVLIRHPLMQHEEDMKLKLLVMPK